MAGIETEIKDLLANLTKLYNDGEIDAVSDLYTTDFKMMYPGRGVMTGKEVAGMAHKRMKAENVTVVSQSVEDVGGMGDEAWARGVTKLTRGEANTPEQVNYLMIFKKTDGKWFIHVSCVCSNTPPSQ